ncbi:MAG TPA: outer membrane beta-barrel protein [Chryseolinea sp.]
MKSSNTWRNLFALSCLLVVNVTAIAQTYRQGYIIVATDTVKGLIKYRGTKGVSQKCSFRKSMNEAVSHYAPNTIVAYGFDGRHFRVLQQSDGAYFAEVLVDGNVSLLRQRSNYQVSKNGSLVDISPSQSEVVVNGQRYTSTAGSTQKIKALVEDCPELNARATQFSYSEKHLVTLVEDYNRCKGQPYKVYRPARKKSEFGWGVYAGLAQPNFKTTSSYSYYNSGDYHSPVSFTGGLFIRSTLPSITERLQIQQEVAYFQTQASHSYFSYTVLRDVSISFEYSGIKAPVSFRYSFLDKNIKPYVRLGVVPAFLFKREVHNDAQPDRHIALNDVNFSLLGGLGLETKISKHKALFLEFRYEKSGELLVVRSDNGNTHGSVRYLSLVGGFKF